MIEAGINTIRLYEPVDDINVMNKIPYAGIKLIIDLIRSKWYI